MAYRNKTSSVRKVFRYNCVNSESWTLPSHEALDCEIWSDSYLQSLKVQVNQMKGSLNDIDINAWRAHTGETHLGGSIQQLVHRSSHAELCTQAWCKFHEILSQFNLINVWKGDYLRSVHLCEAPGAFVACLNHFLRSGNYSRKWQWWAVSANPYYEGNEPSSTIFDDTLIRESRENWFFGHDNSGDVTKLENLLSLVDRIGKGKANLVTADGSVSCADCPDKQEEVVSFLLFAEVVNALHVISLRGNFVIKMFTMFESTSISLVYLLNFLFANVFVIKPLASKPGNSEVYVVCRGFLGIGQNLMDKLTVLIDNSRPFILPRNLIPESFMREHRSCCTFFTRLQIQAILLNLDLYHSRTIDYMSAVLEMRKSCGNRYIEDNEVKPISKNQKLIRRTVDGLQENRSMFRSSVCGSYNERKMASFHDVLKELPISETAPLSLPILWLYQGDVIQPLNWCFLEITVGALPIKIRSSRYCEQDVFDQYNLFIEKAKDKPVNNLCIPVRVVHSNLLRVLNLQSHEVEWIPLHSDWRSDFTAPETSHSCTTDRRIHLTDVTGIDDDISSLTFGELRSKKQLLDAVIQCIRNSSPGDHFACRIYASLTRFTVSIVYLLKIHFSMVTVDSLGDHIYCYLICTTFIRTDSCLLGRLSRARELGDTIMQLLPVSWLERASFQKKMTEMNGRILLHRLNVMFVDEELTAVQGTCSKFLP